MADVDRRRIAEGRRTAAAEPLRNRCGGNAEPLRRKYGTAAEEVRNRCGGSAEPLRRSRCGAAAEPLRRKRGPAADPLWTTLRNGGEPPSALGGPLGPRNIRPFVSLTTSQCPVAVAQLAQTWPQTFDLKAHRKKNSHSFLGVVVGVLQKYSHSRGSRGRHAKKER